MIGGAGNDIFYVDQSDDQVIELAGQGTDVVYASVDYVLATGSYVQKLILTGSASQATGNEFANTVQATPGSTCCAAWAATTR